MIENILSFSHGIWFGVEKQRENIVCINLLLYSYQILKKVTNYKIKLNEKKERKNRKKEGMKTEKKEKKKRMNKIKKIKTE